MDKFEPVQNLLSQYDVSLCVRIQRCERHSTASLILMWSKELLSHRRVFGESCIVIHIFPL